MRGIGQEIDQRKRQYQRQPGGRAADTGQAPAHWRALVMAANGTAPVVMPLVAAPEAP